MTWNELREFLNELAKKNDRRLDNEVKGYIMDGEERVVSLDTFDNEWDDNVVVPGNLFLGEIQ